MIYKLKYNTNVTSYKTNKCQLSTMATLKGHYSLPWFLLKCSQNLTQFLEVSNSFQKFETVLRSLKQFSEVLNSSWKSQTVLGSFKQCSRKSQTVLDSLKQLSEVSKNPPGLKQFSEIGLGVPNSSRNLKHLSVVSMSCWGSKKILGIFKKLSVLPESVCTAIRRSVAKLGTLQQNPRIKSLKEFNLLLKLAAVLKSNSFVEKFPGLY